MQIYATRHWLCYTHFPMTDVKSGSLLREEEQLREAVLQYLQKHNTMVLASSVDNIPWSCAIFYASDSFNLYFLSSTNTRHAENIARNNRISATITEDYKDWTKIKGIQLEGVAKLLTEDADKMRAIKVYLTRYPFVHPFLAKMMAPFPRVFSFLQKLARALPAMPDFSTSPAEFYRLDAEHVWFVDNERGLGNRKEVST